MQKITTHVWFDMEAKEAAEFYPAAFSKTNGSSPVTKGSSAKGISAIHNTPLRAVDTVTIELYGQGLMLKEMNQLQEFENENWSKGGV